MNTLRFSQPSYADSFVHVLLQPGIRELEMPEGNKITLSVVLHNLFRQMEMWKYGFSSLPLLAGWFYDPGVPEKEAREVYAKLDAVFKDVFPAQAALSRQDAADYMEKLVANVYKEACEGSPGVPGDKQHLCMFMERLILALNGKLA